MKKEQFEQMLEKASKSVQALNRDIAKVCPVSSESPFDSGVVTPSIWKRIRQNQRPLINKLETEFVRYYETFAHAVLIPQAVRFRLGNGIWYKPDFMIFSPSVIAFEIKGPHAYRGGLENLKVAAGLYPKVLWQLWWKESGKWRCQNVLP